MGLYGNFGRSAKEMNFSCFSKPDRAVNALSANVVC